MPRRKRKSREQRTKEMKERMRIYRQDPDRRQKEQIKDTIAHGIAREDLERKAEEQKRNTYARRIARRNRRRKEADQQSQSEDPDVPSPAFIFVPVKEENALQEETLPLNVEYVPVKEEYEVDSADNRSGTFFVRELKARLNQKLTGASSGIGACTAKVFAKNRARLAICGRKEEMLNEVAGECCALGLGSHQIKCLLGDLTDLEVCKRIVSDVIEEFGQLDVLVNNAGCLSNHTIETVTPEQYDTVMSINTRSVVFLTQFAVPHLIKSKGAIVNVSSVTGLRSFPGVLAYCMSKAALDQFTRCTALELGSKGVRVNAVNPGVIKTEIHRRGGMSEADYKKFLDHGKETHALGRVGEVEELANAIAFFAANESSFITGATMPVDGGRHAMCPR